MKIERIFKFKNQFLILLLLSFGFISNAQIQITSSGSNLTISDPDGANDTITLSQYLDSIKINIISATYSLNGGPIKPFPVNVEIPTNLLTVNAGVGNDIINIDGFTATLPSITINGDKGNDNVFWNGEHNFASNASVDMDLQNDDAIPGIDNVVVQSGTIELHGTGIILIKASQNISFNPTTITSTEDGNITIESNMQAVPTTGNFHGIFLDGSSILIHNSGLLQLKGKGGNAASTPQSGIFLSSGTLLQGGNLGLNQIEAWGGNSLNNKNEGISVKSNAKIKTIGGNLKLIGYGGDNTFLGNNSGINIQGEVSTINSGSIEMLGIGGNSTGSGEFNVGIWLSGLIKTSNSDILITATGGFSPIASYVSQFFGFYSNAGSVEAGEDGNIEINGTGGSANGNNNSGIFLTNASTILSNNGFINMNGLGGGVNTSQLNKGVEMKGINTKVSSLGNGTITINGTGGNQSGIGDGNFGIHIYLNAMINSNGNDIDINGVGGSESSNSANNKGIEIGSGGKIIGGGSGNVYVNGQGSSSTGIGNIGIQILGTTSLITSSGGHVTITGIGGTSNQQNNNGILISNGSLITAGGMGEVTVIGHSSTSQSPAVEIRNTGSSISSSGGNISVRGVSDNDSHFGLIILEPSTSIILPSDGRIEILSDELSIDNTATISTNINGTVNIRPLSYFIKTKTGGDLSDSSLDTLDIIDSELDRIFTGTLILGCNYCDDLIISGNITRSNMTHIELLSFTNINFIGGKVNTNLGNLFIQSGSLPSSTRPTQTLTEITAANTTLGGPLYSKIDAINPTIDLKVEGTIDLASNDLNLETIDHSLSGGETFTIIDNDDSDPVIGTFNGLPEGFIFTNFLNSGMNGIFSYIGGTGNDVVITVCVPPSFSVCPDNILDTNSAGQCSKIINYVATAAPSVSYTYNFTGATLGSGSGTGSGSLFNVGTTNVTITATNDCSTATCSFSISISDTELPTITCTSNVIVNNTTGLCGAIVTYSAPTYSDNCSGATSSQIAGLSSGSNFAVGTTTNTFLVTDASSNTNTCSFTITVNDNQLPDVICPSNVVDSTNANSCIKNVSYSGTASDNCSISSLIFSPTSGSSFNIGTAIVTMTATDQSGNSKNCNFTVTINPRSEKCGNNYDDDCDGLVDEGCAADVDGDGINDDIDNCKYISNSNQADSDCDDVGDVCDLCDGGDDKIDNNNDGQPDCKIYPGFNNLPQSWICNAKFLRVYLCHITKNTKSTLCVNSNAISGHLSRGDYLGICNQVQCNNNLTSGSNKIESFSTDIDNHFFEEFEITPNPSLLEFEFVRSHRHFDIEFKVYNVIGNLILSKVMKKDELNYSFGKDFNIGIYFVEIKDEENKTITKIIKQ